MRQIGSQMAEPDILSFQVIHPLCLIEIKTTVRLAQW